MRFLNVFIAAIIFFAVSSANAAVVVKEVEYKDGDVTLKGTLAYDESISSLRPGVLLVPEWWGHNDYIKARAKQMAEDGYVAFAIDMYGDGKITADPKEAGEFAKKFYEDRKLMRSRARAGLEVLRSQVNVDKNKIAVIGFCFGGTVALELARDGEDVKGVAAFHAGLQFPDAVQKGKVKAKILVLNGAADPMVPFEDRQKFITEMQAAEVDLQFNE